MRLTGWGALLFMAVVLFSSPPAAAHGPCPRCIEPSTARADSKLRVDYPTFRAVWNPTRRVLTMGPRPNCYGCNLRLWRFHVEDSPSSIVYDGIRQPGFVFRAPDIEPGRYLVALFDGSEGGTHYTWDFVTLEAGLPEKAADDGLPGWAIGVAVGAGVLIAAAAAVALRYRGRSAA
jgi:hypothetical protein